jgi:AraC family transcriptional regulator, transcriptional activator of pobA
MLNTQPRRIKTISEYHQLMWLPKPEHPLISLINFESIKHMPGGESISLVFDFYSISLKRNFNGKMKYGSRNMILMRASCFSFHPDRSLALKLKKIPH